MAKVKIISNPYMKSIQYMRWVEKVTEYNEENSQPIDKISSWANSET